MHPAISSHSVRFPVLLLVTGVLLALALPALADIARSGPGEGSASLLLAQASGDEGGGKLEPRYQPREPEPKSAYNSSSVFGMTRGVADSTIHPAVKAPLFLFTLPLDLVLLPFAALGGLFG